MIKFDPQKREGLMTHNGEPVKLSMDEIKVLDLFASIEMKCADLYRQFEVLYADLPNLHCYGAKQQKKRTITLSNSNLLLDLREEGWKELR